MRYSPAGISKKTLTNRVRGIESNQEESMERFLVSSFDTYNQKFLGRSHKGFQQAEGELEQMLSQLIEN